MTANPKLYRSSDHPSHWFVYAESEGWLIFPAKVQGWLDRRRARDFTRRHLYPVPLWMAFKTGLDDAVRSRRSDQAA